MQQVTEPAQKYRNDRSAHWQKIAESDSRDSKLLRASYHKYLRKLYRFLAPEGLRVLELGCAEGHLLAALKPSCGVGIDFAPAMLELAKKQYPNLHFLLADIHDFNKELAAEVLAEPFDVVVLSDVVNDSWDMLELLQNLKQFCKPETRVFFNFHSHLWEHPFHVLQKFKLVSPRLVQNWFTPKDMEGLLTLAGYKLIRSFSDYLFPLSVPGISALFNRFLAKLWPFYMFNLFHVQIAKPVFTPKQMPSVSIIIPARNEAGNIEAALQRTPDLGADTEIIFVEGNSTDNTWDVIQEMARKYSHRKIKTLRQPGRGKGDAVRVGFDAAEGDVLMILDADLTMPPETLPQFYEAIASGKAEFVNGVRLVYPQEKQAMRFFNLIGNKFFALAFSWLLGRPIKDTLCGTKVLSRENYQKIAANRSYFGDFDPFGDFDLIFGAAKLNLDIVDLPVRYRERTYGETNISRWRDGWILLKMVCFAARRIKFVP
jgi:SAM-dependent methyltransferase